MSKRALSVTLAPENILWLKARARGVKARSVSETLDRLLLEVRSGRVIPSPARSVRGTVTIDPSDPDLARADDAVRRLVASSLSRGRQPFARSKPRRG
jgi:hypothetical protein